MRHLKGLFLICVFLCVLSGCSGSKTGGSGTESTVSEPASAAQEEDRPAEAQGEAPATPKPTKEDVSAARERALEGMAPEAVERLNEVIIAANLKLEGKYLNDNLFGKLENPDSLEWNYFDQTGEIQTGWAYDGSLDMDAVCGQEGLTREEFYNKYGTKVSTTNYETADDFIALMNTLKASVQNEALKADLQYMADEMELAKDHVMEHVNNVYKKLHDLDYFLLRYGPEVFEGYTSHYDQSTVSKYYGTLSIYDAL